MKREELLKLHQELAAEARALMERKNQDYATDKDPFRNFRLFGALGIAVRLSDKVSRIATILETGHSHVHEESLHDTVLDIINYAVLFEGMLRDQK